MEVQVLGPLRVVIDGSPLSLPGRYTAAAVAYLTLTPDRDVPWQELATAAGDASNGISGPAPLRRLRTEVRACADLLPSSTLSAAATVRLALPAGALDAERFAAAVRDAERAWEAADWVTCRTRSAAALALWRGDPYQELVNCLEAVAAVQRLRNVYVRAWEFHQELAIRAGVDFNVLARARQLADVHPERRTFRLQLARALHLAGRHVEALAELRDTAAVLGDSQLTRRITKLITQRDPAVASAVSVDH